MSRLTDIAVYPIKALDPMRLDRVGITDVGGLEGDRTYGIVDRDGQYVHGKRTAAVHRLEGTVDPETGRVEIGTHDDGTVREYVLPDDREALEAWLTGYFDLPVALNAEQGGAQTDGTLYTEESESGPTVVSRATLREVASWYEGITPAQARLRFRPNLVVDGVPAFWEDKLLADGGRRLDIGDVTVEGVMSVPRCAVPVRDPRTGEEYDGFRETFVRKRRETLPDWTTEQLLDGNLFSLTTLVRIPPAERSGTFQVGDPVGLRDADRAADARR